MTAPRPPRGQRRPAASTAVDPATPRASDELPGGDGDARTGAADGADEVRGVELAAVRTGDDSRRRGWFWHWNSIVTQYAPLIGLKGVGLLNSYTVWTDRRESSPLRGYAFPSQQSEADFYGEDRAELIAINKILVALDLIEIKKEMVLRVDERGHRWRVPHNLYRVKDTDDSRGLTTADVLRVTELAERDAAVYRYLRRVFSARFAPIDPANVWHAILPEVRRDPAWQRLAAKTAREEERFSARSKAGHASRRSGTGAPIPIAGAVEPSDADVAATGTDAGDAHPDGVGSPAETTPNDTGGAGHGSLRATTVATGNDGLGPDVGSSNSGLAAPATMVGRTAVGPTNQGRPTGVAPSNTIEDQSTTTTTTTHGAGEDDGGRTLERPSTTAPWDNVVRIVRPVTASGEAVTAPVTTGGLGVSQVDSGVHPTVDAEVATVHAAADGRAAGPVGGLEDGRDGTRDLIGETAADATAQGHGDAAQDVGDPVAGSRARRQDDRVAARQGADRRRQDEALALTAFEAANGGRVVTPAEVQILRQLAGQLDASAAADPELTTGWAWLGAAVYEAVDAGSAYVAPRRIREIATRWQREGRPGVAPRSPGEQPSVDLPPAVLTTLTADRSASEVDAPRGGSTDARRSADGDPLGGSARRRSRDRSPAVDEPLGEGARGTPARLGSADTHEGEADGSSTAAHDAAALWDAVLRELARDLAPARLAELSAVQVARATMDEVELAAPPDIAAALGNEERPLLARALSAALRRTVRLTIRPLPVDVPPVRPNDATGPRLEPGATSSASDRNGTDPAPGRDASDATSARGGRDPQNPWPHPGLPSREGSQWGRSDASPSQARRVAEASPTIGFTADRPIPETTDGPSNSSPGVAPATGRDGDLSLSDAHLWAAVVDEVVRAGNITAADVAAWLRPARIAGRTPGGGHVVVAPSAAARRRLDGPLRPALEAALARVLGPRASFEVTTARSG